MSTTAGLGSGDYVAVNGTAVFALLVGVASALALMSEILLILPLVGIVAAFVAWKQIRQSNGTQTGKGLVIIAIVLALGFGGFVFGRWATEGYRTAGDRKAIDALIKTLEAKIKADDVAGAYQLFGQRFTSVIDQQAFAARLTLLQGYYGKVTKIDSNGLVEFSTEDTSGDRFAFTKIALTCEKAPGDKGTGPLTDTASFRKDEAGQWKFERMGDLFPPPTPPGQPRRPQG